jgi:hypothetical protein
MQAVQCLREEFGEEFVIPIDEVQLPVQRDLRYILLQVTGPLYVTTLRNHCRRSSDAAMQA